MSAIPLGRAADGGALAVDLDTLVGGHCAIVANSGGGKSGLLRRLLEASHGAIQHIVLDIEDEFYTLRERFDYVIAGGEGADLPITIAGAADLARATLQHGWSLIVQLNDLGDRAPDFVAAFLGGLMSAPREHWHPALVVIDEAQRFVSPKVPTPALAAVTDLVNRGRKRGFTAVVASLRLADAIAPEIRAMVNNWLLGRVGQTLDRNAMAEQLGFTAKEGRERLRAIEPRHFWGMGPAIAAEATFFRVDDVETTPVRSGQARLTTPPAPEALREILAGLAAAAAPAAETDVRRGPGGLSDATIPADPADAYAVGRAAGEMLLERERRIAELEKDLADARNIAFRLREKIAAAYDPLRRAIASNVPHWLLEAGAVVDISDVDAKPPDANRQVDDVAYSQRDQPAVPGRELRALAGLCAVYPAGLTEAAWAQRTGYARKGGAWIRRRKRYVDEGAIEQRDGRWYATALGLQIAGAAIPALPEPGPALVTWWADRLDAGAGRILKLLAAVHPKSLTRDAIASEVGMTAGGGAFNRYVGALKTAELATETGRRLAISPGLLP